MSVASPSGTAPFNVMREGNDIILQFQGKLDDSTVAECWRNATKEASRAKALRLDCRNVEYCGGAGFALLTELEEIADKSKASFKIEGLAPRFAKMFDAVDRRKLWQPPAPQRQHINWITEIGETTIEHAKSWEDETSFVGEVGTGLLSLSVNPRKLRFREWWSIFEKAGTNALPIVALISFLMGMIMAFQSAMPMRQFGVDIFVVNLVALAIARELGPLMTAVVLAGRSGSAFAAEIGTMKVNEEIAALTTMGIDPVRFLAVPRVLAGIAVTPLLTIYAMVIGIAGGFAVMLALGFPLAALTNQLAGSLSIQDVMAGLIKSVFFGAVVAGVGCLRGLQTGAGASAVGDSTTKSVVTAIFLIVVLDAIFAVIYYQLKF